MGAQVRLTFKEVKVKSIDNKSPYFYPNRTLQIIMSGGTITTPDRAATLYEYNQKGRVPTATTINNKVSFGIKKLNLKRIKTILGTNGPYNELLRVVRDANDMMKYSLLRGHLIEPTSTRPSDEADGEFMESGIEYLQKNAPERERFLRFVIKMQTDLGLDIITIPYLSLGISEYQKLIKDITTKLRSQNLEPLFMFDLDYQGRGDKFSSMLSYFIKDIEVKLLGFRHKSFNRHAVSYDILAQYIESDVAFFSFDVERSDLHNSEISTMHYLPFLGKDVFAIKRPQMIVKTKNPEKIAMYKNKERNKQAIKFFNPSTLVVEPSTDRLLNLDAVLEEMKETGNQKLYQILDSYGSIDDDRYKIRAFKSLSRVHELKASTSEFERLQKTVKSQESTEYIRSKRYLQSTLDSFIESRP